MSEFVIFVGVIDDFNAASGLNAVQLNRFFIAVMLATGAVFSCWLMVAGIRSWMRAQSDALETGFMLMRAMLLVVALGAMISWFK